MTKWKKCAITSIVLGVGTMLSGIILGSYVIPSMFNKNLDEQLVIKNTSQGWSSWVTLPPMDFKVYILTVVNDEEVNNGGKLILKEKGPYIYKHYISKYDIDAVNGTLSYYRHHNLVFDENASYPLTEQDNVTVIHLHLLATITQVEKIQPASLKLLNRVIKTVFNDPQDIFLRTNVREFLFDGVSGNCHSDDSLVRIVCDRMKHVEAIRFGDDGSIRFPALGKVNNTDDGRFTAYNGARNISDRGRIIAWKNKNASMDIWESNSSCDIISGTDGSVHRPHLTRSSLMQIFVPNICRTVPLYYKKDIFYKRIPGYRYENDMLYASPSVYPENKCFCTKDTKGIVGEDGCLLNGALEIHRCQGASLVISNPHFLLSHQIYQNGVSGITPSNESHSSFVELEPYTGATIRASMKIQFNMFIRKVEHIYITENLTMTLAPIFWIDESFQLPDEYIGLLYEVFRILKLMKMFYLSVIGSGFTMMSSGIVWLYLMRRRSRSSSIELMAPPTKR